MRKEKSQSLCKSVILTLLSFTHGLSRRGHGHSGTTTPHSRSGSATPQLEDGNTSPLTPESIASSTILNEKNRQLRLAKPKIVMPVLKRSSEIPTGLTKEHQEQGSVRRRVYWQYMKAASVAGFVFFLVSALIHQAINVCSTLVLRSWSEYNQEMGENSSTMRYLAYYAILGLVQILLGFISTVILRVYCALKSAKHLHETVSASPPCSSIAAYIPILDAQCYRPCPVAIL